MNTPPLLPPDSLSAQFAQRLAERDNPLPVVYSQEHGGQRLTPMLLARMAHPERSSGKLAGAANLGPGQAARLTARLRELGLVASTDQGRYTYHRLLPPAEDALLLAVAGPAAQVAEAL